MEKRKTLSENNSYEREIAVSYCECRALVGSMRNNYSGSCLCGEVRFEIEGAFERFFLCHCEYCRKDTGSAHAANLFSSSASLKWVSGQASVKAFTLPSTRHSRSFCGTCGSALPVTQMNGKLLVVPAGSLNSE